MVLELESFEFQTSVATWIAEGRVTSSTGSLATDVQGRLSLTGLPRGTYAWSAEEQGGTVDVFPGRRDKLTVFMP
jgi:DNA-binding beta-propeller fold protein YncE